MGVVVGGGAVILREIFRMIKRLSGKRSSGSEAPDPVDIKIVRQADGDPQLHAEILQKATDLKLDSKSIDMNYPFITIGAVSVAAIFFGLSARDFLGEQPATVLLFTGVITGCVNVVIRFILTVKHSSPPQRLEPYKTSTAETADRSTDARTPPPLPTGDDNADEGKVFSDQLTDEDKFNMGDYPKAQMAIEYRREAEEAWSQAQHLPTAYMRRFLEALDEDPKCDALEALSSLEEEFKKEQRPFDDAAANDALEEVRTISPEAALEFKRVYETFGETVPLPELLRRIKAKYGPMAKNLSLEKKKATAIAALNEAIRHVDASGITDALTALSYEIQVATSSGLLFKRYRVTEPKEKGGRSFDLFNDPDLIAFARKLSIQHGQPPTS